MYVLACRQVENQEQPSLTVWVWMKPQDIPYNVYLIGLALEEGSKNNLV